MGPQKSDIYTKGGDKGKTALLGGTRVAKYHVRIEAYGTIDELIAHVAMLRDMTEDSIIKKELLVILERLMSASSVIASDGTNLPQNMPSIKDDDVMFLEHAIDVIDEALPELSSFILPGGSVDGSQAHVARTVCRRAERNLLKLHETEPVDEVIIRYFNRMSDYFFLLARKLTIDSGAREIPWKP